MNIQVLTSTMENQFYPTPRKLAGMMLAGADWGKIETVLEPSAGKGDLVKAAANAFYNNVNYNSKERGLDVDCIEIDRYLQQILKYNFSNESIEDISDRYRELNRKWNKTRAEAEEYKQLGRRYNAVNAVNMRIVQDDFLSFRGIKRYDLILMNPPFAAGDLHLLKALEIQKDGGQVICLLNAETIRNPYTATRQLLQRKLQEYGAKITFVNDAFRKAERIADVDVAIIKVEIPDADQYRKSDIYERMKKAVEQDMPAYESTDLIYGSDIELMIQQFNIETSAGVGLIREYEAMKPYIMSAIPTESRPNADKYSRPILSLRVGEHASNTGKESINRYLKSVRLKYWEALLQNKKVTGRLTSKLQNEYMKSVGKMADYDFSFFNILQKFTEINGRIYEGVKGSIMNLFDTLTSEYSYYPESGNSNIHYYNGWKTNKAHKIGKKSIIPANGIFSGYSWKTETFDVYRAYEVLCDIEKVLNYLDGRMLLEVDLHSILYRAERAGQTKNIQCKYFNVTFYKKGTVHIMFTDHEIIDKFNIYVGMSKNWLPPDYGNTPYNDLSNEEKAVVDDFQGKKAYETVMANKEFYLAGVGSSNSLLLMNNSDCAC